MGWPLCKESVPWFALRPCGNAAGKRRHHFPSGSLSSRAAEAPAVTLLILLPPCRVRSQACRCSQGSSPPPHCLSQHHQPCSPSSSTLSTKGPRKLVLLARPANPVCQKRYPPSPSQWPLPQRWGFQPLSSGEQPPEQLWQQGLGVAPLQAGRRAGDRLSREADVGWITHKPPGRTQRFVWAAGC